MRPRRWQLTRLPRPWDSPGKSNGVGCHFLLHPHWMLLEYLVEISSPRHVDLFLNSQFYSTDLFVFTCASITLSELPLFYSKFGIRKGWVFLIILFLDLLCLLDSLQFHVNFRIYSYKEINWGFHYDCNEFVDQVREYHHISNIVFQSINARSLSN